MTSLSDGKSGPKCVNSRLKRELTAKLRGPNGEGFIGAAIVVWFLVVGALHPSFFSLGTLFNVLDASDEPALLALGFLLILIAGGIDVSFDAVAIFAGYSVAALVAEHGLSGNVELAFFLACVIGLGLGAVNALIVVGLRLPTLIATLGTRALFAGCLLGIIGYDTINSIPGAIGSMGVSNLVVASVRGQSVGLQTAVIPVVVAALIVAVVLRSTVLGRNVYVLGAGDEASRRSGLPVRRTRMILFCAAGVLDGAAGMVHVSLGGVANPTDMVGNELTVIAAVVLGGASIFGGSGSVTGTMLGVFFIELITYSLIILGISSAWDDFAIGFALLGGILLQLSGSHATALGLAAGRRLRLRTVVSRLAR